MSKDAKRLGLTDWANPNHYYRKKQYQLLKLNLSASSFDRLLQILSLCLC